MINHRLIRMRHRNNIVMTLAVVIKSQSRLGFTDLGSFLCRWLIDPALRFRSVFVYFIIVAEPFPCRSMHHTNLSREPWWRISVHHDKIEPWLICMTMICRPGYNPLLSLLNP